MNDILEKSVLIDTNILVYLLDEKSPYFPLASQLFRWAEEQKIKLVIAQQSLLELIRTLMADYGVSLKLSTAKAGAFINQNGIELIHPLSTTLEKYFKLIQNKNLNKGRLFDWYLAATAFDNGVNQIITNNPKDFAGIKNFRVWSLKETARIIQE